MPSYYQGARDEYGNRDYARRDSYADRYYGPHDGRGSAPPEWDWRLREEEEARWREHYERRYEYPEREDYRYLPELGGEYGYGLDEYGRGPAGYGREREWGPPERFEREWQPPGYGRPVPRSGYGYYREPTREYPRHYGERPSFGEELRYHVSHPPPPPVRRRRRRWRST